MSSKSGLTSAKTNSSVPAEHFSANRYLVVPKSTIIALFFVVMAVTAITTYFVIISSQTPKIVKEPYQTTANSGEIRLFLKVPPKQPEASKSEGKINLNILPQ